MISMAIAARILESTVVFNMADEFGEHDIFAVFDNIDGKKESKDVFEAKESVLRDSGKRLSFQRGEKREFQESTDVEKANEVVDDDTQRFKKAKKLDDER